MDFLSQYVRSGPTMSWPKCVVQDGYRAIHPESVSHSRLKGFSGMVPGKVTEWHSGRRLPFTACGHFSLQSLGMAGNREAGGLVNSIVNRKMFNRREKKTFRLLHSDHTVLQS